MGMQFLLRVDGADSPFRTALGDLMAMSGELLILTSGYVSDELLDPSNKRDFIDKIVKGFKNITNPKLIIVGAKFGYYDKYNNFNTNSTEILKMQYFLNKLRKALPSYITIEYWRSNTDMWHSKIALKVKNKKPISAIVGSSNLTGPAFSIGKPGFNHEADIFIYDGYNLQNGYKGIKSNVLDKEKIQSLVDGYVNDFIGIIKSVNEPNVNEKLTRDYLMSDEQEKLSWLNERIRELQLPPDQSELLRDLLYNIKYYTYALRTTNQNGGVYINTVTNLNPSSSTSRNILLDIYNTVNSTFNIYLNLISPDPTGTYNL